MMNNKKISNGLMQLGFQTGWVVTGDEITLWENSEAQPTEEEIAEAAPLWEKTLLAAEAAKENAKQTAQSKLEALGLTADDLKALGL
jgi:hypothetical protein